MTATHLGPTDLAYGAGDDLPFEELDGAVPVSDFEYLEGLPPGPILAMVLGQIDRTLLSGYDLVLVMKARQRQVSHDQAELYGDMVELGFCPPSDPGDLPVRSDEFFEYTADEVRCALVWTRRAAAVAVDYAFEMMVRFPEIGRALSDGAIDLSRARVIVNEVGGLTESEAVVVIDRILTIAPELTTGQIRSRMRKLCIDADPEAARKRYESGVEARQVAAQPRPEGTADLYGENLESDRVAAIMAQINETARRLRRQGDPRTMDQIKADLFVELLEGRHQGESASQSHLVDIRVDLDTLVGLNDRAGEIPGWGPVIADIARQAIERQPDGQWRIAVSDPNTGAVAWNGTTRRRPTSLQRHHVESRQQECSHPRCRMPAHRCDIDHIEPYAKGGPSVTTNYQPVCRHDHMMKTLGIWQVDQDPSGRPIWVSPHGHRYQQPP